MKTIDELTIELRQLEQARQENRLLASGLASAQQRVAAVTTQVVLGSVGKSELTAAEAALTACTDACSRAGYFDQACADQERLIAEARHQQRSDLIAGLKAEFLAEFTEYTLTSKLLYEQYRRLRVLDNRWRALAPAYDNGLLGVEHLDLHLPAVHGPLHQRAGQSSGRES